jgi:hypothetical protein
MVFFEPGKLELCLAMTLRIRGVSTCRAAFLRKKKEIFVE